VADYRPALSDIATEFVLSLPKRRQRKAMDRIYELARYPAVESDYCLRDADGREVNHLVVDGLVFAYWVDHAVRRVMIVEIDEADV